MTLTIDNKAVTVDKVEIRRGIAHIYINGYAQCHSVPEWYLTSKGKVITNGHTYSLI